MKIILVLSLLLSFSAFADDVVQPTPTDNGKASGVDNSSESAIVPGTPAQEKQIEQNKKEHEENMKAKPKAKAKAKGHAHVKGHAKKASKKAKSKAHKKPKH